MNTPSTSPHNLLANRLTTCFGLNTCKLPRVTFVASSLAFFLNRPKPQVCFTQWFEALLTGTVAESHFRAPAHLSTSCMLFVFNGEMCQNHGCIKETVVKSIQVQCTKLIHLPTNRDIPPAPCTHGLDRIIKSYRSSRLWLDFVHFREFVMLKNGFTRVSCFTVLYRRDSTMIYELQDITIPQFKL